MQDLTRFCKIFNDVWKQNEDQRQKYMLKLEFYTEISIYVFHSQKPADLNFPPMSQLCLKHIRWSPSSISIFGQMSSPVFWLVNYTSIRSIDQSASWHFVILLFYTLIYIGCTCTLRFSHTGTVSTSKLFWFHKSKKNPLQSYLQIWMRTILGSTHWTIAFKLAGNSNQLVVMNGTYLMKSRYKIPTLACLFKESF